MGLWCDICVLGVYNFFYCEVGFCYFVGLVLVDFVFFEVQVFCVCWVNVEGLSCDCCKFGFWGLSFSNFEGCICCSCDFRGMLGGVIECQLGIGQCFCKFYVCGQVCVVCRDGFFGLDQVDYFGCCSCWCDVGGVLGQSCELRMGVCWCCFNIQGFICSWFVRDYYFLDLYYLCLELEEVVIFEGYVVCFGFNFFEFENFSWRGYV